MNEISMNIEFKKVSDFNKGLLLSLLKDSYSFNKKIEERDLGNWKKFDDFFFDNLSIADKYGFVTVLNNTPIGFVSWNPRNRPEYVEIGHNCIMTKYKGNGYGKIQMQEAVRRIKEYESLKKIVVTTDDFLLPAQRMYESVGFKLAKVIKKPIPNELYLNGNMKYEINLKEKK